MLRQWHWVMFSIRLRLGNSLRLGKLSKAVRSRNYHEPYTFFWFSRSAYLCYHLSKTTGWDHRPLQTSDIWALLKTPLKDYCTMRPILMLEFLWSWGNGSDMMSSQKASKRKCFKNDVNLGRWDIIVNPDPDGFVMMCHLYSFVMRKFMGNKNIKKQPSRW